MLRNAGTQSLECEKNVYKGTQNAKAKSMNAGTRDAKAYRNAPPSLKITLACKYSKQTMWVSWGLKIT